MNVILEFIVLSVQISQKLDSKLAQSHIGHVVSIVRSGW